MEFETFRKISDYAISGLKQNEPSAFNGNIEVKKYRVTIEEIPEPDSVIIARLQKLWEECDNHHHLGPIKGVARRYGVDLDNSLFGKKRKKAA